MAVLSLLAHNGHCPLSEKICVSIYLPVRIIGIDQCVNMLRLRQIAKIALRLPVKFGNVNVPARSLAIKINTTRTALVNNRSLALGLLRRFGSSGADEPFLDRKIVTERVIEVVKNFEKVKAEKVTPQAKFKEDLDLDSLDAVEVVMAIEEEFGIEIPDSEADKIYSVADAVNFISAHPMAK